MTAGHVGELKLRRLRAGELEAAEAELAQRHLDGCAECGGLVAGLEAEERDFHSRISFDRFARGVEAKASRSGSVEAQSLPLPSPRGRGGRNLRAWIRRLLPVPLALAAAMAVLLVVRIDDDGTSRPGNRIKGTGAAVTLRIASGDDGPQRTADPLVAEALAPGERIRIGYRPGPHRYLTAVSVDGDGEVSALYPEDGASLPTDGGGAFLPDSIEFTGRGAERVIVVMTEEPLAVSEVTGAARAAYDAADGDVEALPDLELPVPSEQFHQTFLKP